MSMNPARTFGSAFVGHLWTGLWIYFTAPVLAMQLAATLYLRGKGASIARNIIITIGIAAFLIAAFPNCSSASKRSKQARQAGRRSE